ncbi:MAG: energy-coupling factor transporter transmembrane component T [Myxococcota bacterium]
MRRVSPTLAVSYLLALAVGVFFIDNLGTLAVVAVAQGIVGIITGLTAKQVFQPLRKLAVFILLVLASYVLFGVDDTDQVYALAYWPWPLSITGFLFGCAMALRVLSVVSASQWVRNLGQPGDFIHGLRRMGMPETLAEILDHSLLLLEARGGGGRGGGGGKGGGRHRKRSGDGVSLKRLIKGDVGILVDAIEGSIRRAAILAQERPLARDAVILSGLLLTMMGLKLLKIMPGLPFAPGHKALILFPIYLLAARLTERKTGATLLGTAFGLLSFLFGDGRYGVFEILKHIAPGLVADAFAPLLRRERHGFLIYTLAGIAMAIGRAGTIAVVVVMVGAPAAVIAALLPAMMVHVAFGAASGLVARTVMAAAGRLALADRLEHCDGAQPHTIEQGAERGPESNSTPTQGSWHTQNRTDHPAVANPNP